MLLKKLQESEEPSASFTHVFLLQTYTVLGWTISKSLETHTGSGPSIKPGFQLPQRHCRERTGVKPTMSPPPFCLFFVSILLLLLGQFQGVSVERGLSPPECRKQTKVIILQPAG